MRINTPADFRFGPTVFSHGWCQLLPFTYSAEPPMHLTRLHRLSDGTVITIRLEPEGDHGLSASASMPLTAAQQVEVERVVRRCLNLDQDLTGFYDRLRDHHGYGWVKHIGAGRMLICPSVWEDLALSHMLNNQVSDEIKLGNPHYERTNPSHKDRSSGH